MALLLCLGAAQAQNEYGACVYPTTGYGTFMYSWQALNIPDGQVTVKIEPFSQLFGGSVTDYITERQAVRSEQSGYTLGGNNKTLIKISWSGGTSWVEASFNQEVSTYGKVSDEANDINNAAATCMKGNTPEELDKTIREYRKKHVFNMAKTCLPSMPTTLATGAISVLLYAYVTCNP